MKFRPLHDNVLVKRLETTEQRQGGIIIPDTAKEKPQEGRSTGGWAWQDTRGRHRRPVAIAAGNKVLFGKYAGTEITIDSEELLVLRESDSWV